MAAIRYNLTCSQGRTLRRRLVISMDTGQVGDLSYSVRLWERHVPDVPIGAATAIAVPGTSEIEIEIPYTTTEALDTAKVYGYQIDAEAADNVPETIAHGRLYVGEEYREA